MKIAWISLFLIVLVWSGINPKDYPTWALEVAPAVIGFAVLALSRRSFPLTPSNPGSVSSAIITTRSGTSCRVLCRQ